MKEAGSSGYFDTKYMTVLWTEQIVHNFEYQKFANLFNLKQVNFHMTLIICDALDIYMFYRHASSGDGEFQPYEGEYQGYHTSLSPTSR